MHQNINAINLVAERNAKEKEEKRRVVAARINEQIRKRNEQARIADEQMRTETQRQLREEVKRHFMLSPWATEKDFDEAWKRDKLAIIREYEQAQRSAPRM